MHQIQTEATFEQLELLPLPVHGMDVLFRTLWWIFRRVNGSHFYAVSSVSECSSKFSAT
jgi:hypothetical protein